MGNRNGNASESNCAGCGGGGTLPTFGLISNDDSCCCGAPVISGLEGLVTSAGRRLVKGTLCTMVSGFPIAGAFPGVKPDHLASSSISRLREFSRSAWYALSISRRNARRSSSRCAS
jgi:hypothetical protein